MALDRCRVLHGRGRGSRPPGRRSLRPPGTIAAHECRRRTRAGAASGRSNGAMSAAPQSVDSRTGWKETLVSGEMSVKRQSSSRGVGTVSTPTRSTASARNSSSHGERLAAAAAAGPRAGHRDSRWRRGRVELMRLPSAALCSRRRPSRIRAFEFHRQFLAARPDDAARLDHVHVVRHDIVEQALVVRHQHDRVVLVASLLTPPATTRSASMSSPESVSSRSASVRLQQRHLQNFVSLLLATRETLVHASVEEIGIHFEQLHFFAHQVVELEGIELVLAALRLAPCCTQGAGTGCWPRREFRPDTERRGIRRRAHAGRA